MIRLAIALVLSTLATAAESGVPEQRWIPVEITSGKKPVRVVIMKTGWRGGPEALVIDKKRDVQSLYGALSGNARLGFTCGYHWSFLFEYEGAAAESIDINENCETFRRDPERTWRIVSDAFEKAKAHPSHFAAELAAEPKADERAVRETASRFGFVVPAQPAVLLARHPWSSARIARVNRALGRLGRVKPIEAYDTGN